MAQIILTRGFFVSIGNYTLTLTYLTCGIPQRSILGPLLFNLKMLQLGQIIKDNEISYQSVMNASHRSTHDIDYLMPLYPFTCIMLCYTIETCWSWPLHIRCLQDNQGGRVWVTLEWNVRVESWRFVLESSVGVEGETEVVWGEFEKLHWRIGHLLQS